ncbi:hypothetical protein BDZ45DRAFT_735742 [Acephala macrosclerotiorum]|nr:hypothetical protein BDZ45DRAFT_735742 [Acephala macrosclerotiorum]
MQSSAPETPITLDITSTSLKDSIKTFNRLSQVMNSQIQSQGVSHGPITPPMSRNTSYNKNADGTKFFIPTTADTILSQPDRTGYVVPTSLGKGKGKEVVIAESSKPVSSSSLKTPEPTITPGMSDFEKSVIAKASKEKAESEGFWERFAAAQTDREKLSVNHPWYQEIVANFRAEQSAKAANEKEERDREADLGEARGPVKDRKRVRAMRFAKRHLMFKIGL